MEQAGAYVTADGGDPLAAAAGGQGGAGGDASSWDAELLALLTTAAVSSAPAAPGAGAPVPAGGGTQPPPSAGGMTFDQFLQQRAPPPQPQQQQWQSQPPTHQHQHQQLPHQYSQYAQQHAAAAPLAGGGGMFLLPQPLPSHAQQVQARQRQLQAAQQQQQQQLQAAHARALQHQQHAQAVQTKLLEMRMAGYQQQQQQQQQFQQFQQVYDAARSYPPQQPPPAQGAQGPSYPAALPFGPAHGAAGGGYGGTMQQQQQYLQAQLLQQQLYNQQQQQPLSAAIASVPAMGATTAVRVKQLVTEFQDKLEELVIPVGTAAVTARDAVGAPPLRHDVPTVDVRSALETLYEPRGSAAAGVLRSVAAGRRAAVATLLRSSVQPAAPASSAPQPPAGGTAADADTQTLVEAARLLRLPARLLEALPTQPLQLSAEPPPTPTEDGGDSDGVVCGSPTATPAQSPGTSGAGGSSSSGLPVGLFSAAVAAAMAPGKVDLLRCVPLALSDAGPAALDGVVTGGEQQPAAASSSAAASLGPGAAPPSASSTAVARHAALLAGRDGGAHLRAWMKARGLENGAVGALCGMPRAWVETRARTPQGSGELQQLLSAADEVLLQMSAAVSAAAAAYAAACAASGRPQLPHELDTYVANAASRLVMEVRPVAVAVPAAKAAALLAPTPSGVTQAAAAAAAAVAAAIAGTSASSSAGGAAAAVGSSSGATAGGGGGSSGGAPTGNRVDTWYRLRSVWAPHFARHAAGLPPLLLGPPPMLGAPGMPSMPTADSTLSEQWQRQGMTTALAMVGRYIAWALPPQPGTTPGTGGAATPTPQADAAAAPPPPTIPLPRPALVLGPPGVWDRLLPVPREVATAPSPPEGVAAPPAVPASSAADGPDGPFSLSSHEWVVVLVPPRALTRINTTAGNTDVTVRRLACLFAEDEAMRRWYAAGGAGGSGGASTAGVTTDDGGDIDGDGGGGSDDDHQGGSDDDEDAGFRRGGGVGAGRGGKKRARGSGGGAAAGAAKKRRRPIAGPGAALSFTVPAFAQQSIADVSAAASATAAAAATGPHRPYIVAFDAWTNGLLSDGSVRRWTAPLRRADIALDFDIGDDSGSGEAWTSSPASGGGAASSSSASAPESRQAYLDSLWGALQSGGYSRAATDDDVASALGGVISGEVAYQSTLAVHGLPPLDAENRARVAVIRSLLDGLGQQGLESGNAFFLSHVLLRRAGRQVPSHHGTAVVTLPDSYSALPLARGGPGGHTPLPPSLGPGPDVTLLVYPPGAEQGYLKYTGAVEGLLTRLEAILGIARALSAQSLNATAASSAEGAAQFNGVFALLTALTADVVAWAVSDVQGHSAPSTSAATYWHRPLGAELLWRLLEAWQMALVSAARSQVAWGDRFSAQYSMVAANGVGDGVERAIRVALSMAAPPTAAAASASAATDGGAGAAAPSLSSSTVPAALPSNSAAVAGPPTATFLASVAAMARGAAQRATLLNSIQAAAGALQACLWAASALLPRAADEAAAAAELQSRLGLPPGWRPLVSLPEVLLAGASVLALAPHPLRLLLREP